MDSSDEDELEKLICSNEAMNEGTSHDPDKEEVNPFNVDFVNEVIDYDIFNQVISSGSLGKCSGR